MLTSATTADIMDEIFFNSTDDNVTSSWNVSSLLHVRERSRMSADQLYACNLYKFVMSGVVQLIVSIIGFVGKSIKQKPFRNIAGRSLRKGYVFKRTRNLSNASNKLCITRVNEQIT